MNFPIIKTIDDILPHIEGNENFSVHKKDDYIVIDYILNTSDMFQNPYQKECRGILFYEDGRIMARRLHKFFNLNERPESSIDKIDLSKEHWILEKLDGSMISPMTTHGKLTWGSKAGITFLTPQIEEFVKNHSQYKEFCKVWISLEFTPIFEWCSNKNRIVISYPEDRLVLIGMRHNKTGEYISYGELYKFAYEWNIDIVKQYEGTVRNMLHFSDDVKKMSGIEGFIIRFADGHMIKMKCDEYVLCHKAKNDLFFEKNIVAIIAEGKSDDFRVLISEDDRKKFEEFENKFYEGIRKRVTMMKYLSSTFNFKKMTKKEFSLDFGEKIKGYQKSIIFKFFNTEPSINDIREEIMNIVKKNTNSQANIDKVRELWDSHKWVY